MAARALKGTRKTLENGSVERAKRSIGLRELPLSGRRTILRTRTEQIFYNLGDEAVRERNFMDSFDATRCANSAIAATCYHHFLRLVAAVADRHHAYLHAHGLVIIDCYQLTFRYANARLQIQPGLPQPLYEQLRQAFVDSFGT